ncbi:Tautomerase [Penicillium sp. IBT 35674x]|nr:Tautomerase [Penicillium sp. IBT 35674x]
MELSNQKKPSLPRLSTNNPLESQSTPLLSLLPKLQDTNVRPKRERPATLPSPFPGREENISPTVRDVPKPKLIYSTKGPEDTLVKKKPHYHENTFGTPDSHHSPQDRLLQDSVVVAELKTNCRVQDEQQKLVADLIFRLAQIYQRPETCIMLTIQQDAGVFFGSTTELSYLLKIYALPSFIAPFTNLRNTNLIQAVMLDLLHIPRNQGVIIFLPVSEDNLATDGLTARGEIARLERNDQDENPNLFKTISRSMSRRFKTSSGQSVPISLPSTVGTSTASPSNQTEIRHSPITVDDTAVPTEERGKGTSLRKRISLRGLVRRRLMDITSALDKDEKGKAKGVTKEGDSKEDQPREKAKNLIFEDEEEQ